MPPSTVSSVPPHNAFLEPTTGVHPVIPPEAISRCSAGAPPVWLEVVTRLRELLEVETAAYLSFGAVDDGFIPAEGWQLLGNPRHVEPSHTMLLAGFRQPAALFRGPRMLRERLVGLESLARHLGRDLVNSVWNPLEQRLAVRSQARVLLFDGDTLLGWLGATSSRPGPFDPRLLRRANAALAPMLKQLVEVERARRTPACTEPGDLVVTEAGDVESASDAGRAWLSAPEFLEALRSTVRGFDGKSPLPRGVTVRGGRARIVRVTGSGTTRYVVHVVPAPANDRIAPSLVLTPTQARVAKHAVLGATATEIAKQLGCSPETVRVHLRECYRRLGVANRVELIRALGDALDETE